MDQKAMNLRVLSTQFLLWWVVCFACLQAVFMIMMPITSGPVPVTFRDVLFVAECAVLASLMSIIHCYFFVRGYFAQKKYLAYLATSGALVIVFVLLDFMLFRFRIGEYFFLKNTPSHLILVNCQRVIIAYVPLALVYALFRSSRDRKLQKKNG